MACAAPLTTPTAPKGFIFIDLDDVKAVSRIHGESGRFWCKYAQILRENGIEPRLLASCSERYEHLQYIRDIFEVSPLSSPLRFQAHNNSELSYDYEISPDDDNYHVAGEVKAIRAGIYTVTEAGLKKSVSCCSGVNMSILYHFYAHYNPLFGRFVFDKPVFINLIKKCAEYKDTKILLLDSVKDIFIAMVKSFYYFFDPEKAKSLANILAVTHVVSAKRLAEFKILHKENYSRFRFFNLSEMASILSSREVTYEDLIDHVRKKPNSRTARILRAMMMDSADAAPAPEGAELKAEG